MKTRKLTTKDRSRLRQALSTATERHGVGGLERTKLKPKPISLPQVSILKEDEGEQ